MTYSFSRLLKASVFLLCIMGVSIFSYAQTDAASDKIQENATEYSLEEAPSATEEDVTESPSLSVVAEDPLANIGVSNTDNSKIKTIGGNVIAVLKTFAVLGIAISLILAAITLMTQGYRAKNFVAEDVMMKLIILAIFAGLSFFVNIDLTVVQGL